MSTPRNLRRLRPHHERGIALVVALIFLVIVSILGITAVKFTTAAVRESLNDEYRTNSFELAQSVIEATIGNSANTQVSTEDMGDLCTKNVDCANPDVVLANDAYAEELDANAVSSVVRKGNPFIGPPPRGARGGSSIRLFDAANFLITATHDETLDGKGATTINQGLIILVPKFGV